jgi:hypothetical protein
MCGSYEMNRKRTFAVLVVSLLFLVSVGLPAANFDGLEGTSWTWMAADDRYEFTYSFEAAGAVKLVQIDNDYGKTFPTEIGHYNLKGDAVGITVDGCIVKATLNGTKMKGSILCSNGTEEPWNATRNKQ